VVAFIFREEVYSPTSRSWKGFAELIIRNSATSDRHGKAGLPQELYRFESIMGGSGIEPE